MAEINAQLYEDHNTISDLNNSSNNYQNSNQVLMPEDNNSNHDLTEGTTNYDSGSLPHFEEKERIIEAELYESNNSFDDHQKRDEMQVGHYEKVTNNKPPNLPKKGNNNAPNVSKKSDNNNSKSSLHFTKQVTLQKNPGEKLGITVKEDDNKRIVIGRILKGEKADLSGLLHPEDIIISINDFDLTDGNMSKEEVIEVVANTFGTLDFVIQPGENHMRQNNNNLNSNSSSPKQLNGLISTSAGHISSTGLATLTKQQSTTNGLNKSIFGSTILDNHGNVKYKNVFIKSKINWDPQKDQGIPCKDAKMSYPISIGDYLEILSFEDQNWWQARKVGTIFDKDTFGRPGSTGIIPSNDLLESRVRAAVVHNSLLSSPSTRSNHSIKQQNSPTEEKTTTNNNPNNSILKSPSKSKKLIKKISFSKNNSKNESSDNNNRLKVPPSPLRSKQANSSSAVLQNNANSNSSSSDFNNNLTTTNIKVNDSYLELVKIPNSELTTHQKRRPISIIGPRGIGIMDLRSKLIDSNPSLYDLPIPHTSRPALVNEVDGKDYNFVNKDEMKKLIRDGTMIEWGEYNDQYYGTSVDSIVAARYNQKVSLVAPMNLSQAIPKLASKKIQSYVILLVASQSEYVKKHESREGLSNNNTILNNSASHHNNNNSNDFLDNDLSDNADHFNKICRDSDNLFKKYHHVVDKVIVYRNFEQAFRELEQASFSLMNFDQFLVKDWVE